ncbi:Eco57I restriction-modification methylase domain-containing protein [Dietzia sp. UCD-THP]|uniref:Eco57I restriction-modification methylase domain-containing protein n=1 Tax=Dietzia sp. UCD-THP TaxID=1292020 RepID=UPI001EE64C88|nr:Eco57I restriction-modification methylase domain-containing protein [Dietzia sp. UCD-THP]
MATSWADANGGESIWSNPEITFLDPFTKSGVFLREITTRLTKGLASSIPNLEERVDHILTRQVFGMAITQLTSLLARRSLYCSKSANSQHSIARSFDNEAGNVWFERIDHVWVGGTKLEYSTDSIGRPTERYTNGRCRYCRAPQQLFDREQTLESHAYAFIHTDDVQALVAELFGEDMRFDVVIGNPPYQMTGGAGGSSDSSIYHLFVEQAKKLEPRLLTMVIPSRWLAGGRGMGNFRRDMLTSGHLMKLVDYPVSREVFPGVEVKGGICYFLSSSEHKGPCDVTIVRGDEQSSTSRQLDEFDVFVRDPRAVKILRKVLSFNETPITDILTADTPFGIATNFKDHRPNNRTDDVALHLVSGGKRKVGYVPRSIIKKNSDLIDKWKVLAPKAGSDGGQKIPDSVLGKPWLAAPPAAATQTFLAFYVDNEDDAHSVESYYRTKFFRFLVGLRKITQDALKPMYSWVPMQTWDREWSDIELYDKYGLSDEERDYIELVIRPMEVAK